MPASIGYSDDKKKEYAGRFIGGVLSFLIKKVGVPDEIANTVGDEFGGFVTGVELTDNRADTVEKHWGQVLDRTWKQMRGSIDLPNEFWEPLEETLFQTPDIVELFLRNYREIKVDDDSVLSIYTQLDATIHDIHKNSEMIDVESIPKDISKKLACSLKQEIKNDISLLGIVQYLVEKLNQGGALPIKQPTKISLTTIPAAVDLIGRDKDITAIKALLVHHPIVSIYADGGVGKTAVALQIINTTKGKIECGESKYKNVAWIRSTGDLKNDLSALSIPGIKGEESIDDKFKAACTFLEMNPTFLVIDNMDVPPSTEDINALNTVSGSTKILITTRIKIKNSQQHPLEHMDKQDATTLFYKYYLDVAEVPETKAREDDKTYVEMIVDKASCNALLIELIAKMACWEYTDRLDELWAKLEKDVFGTNSEIDLETKHAESHKYGVLSEGDLKLQGQISNLYRMSGLDDTKQELMRFIAAFPAETIIFTDAFKWSGFKISDMKNLADRGWIEKAGEGYLIHTMVQGSVILQKKEFDIEKYENLIKELSNIDQYMPDGTVFTKVRERIVVPDSVCGLLSEIGSQKQEAATLFNNIGGVCKSQGDYEKALEYYKKAIAIREKVLGAEHPDTAITNNNIAVVYQKRGDYEKGLEYYKKAIAIIEKVLGIENPLTATTYNNIASVYKSQGDYEKALEYNNKALAICVKVLGLEHPDTAMIYNSIADVFQAKGDYEKALEYYKKAIAIREKVYGAEHPSTATTYNNIAVVYRGKGDNVKALEYYKKVIAIREKVYGTEHPDTVMTYSNVALVYQDEGDYEKALEQLQKALVIIEKVLGAEHPYTATLLNNIAGVYQDQGEYKKALEYNNKALAINEKVLGSEHPDIATSYNNVALLYQGEGDYEKALEYYKKALAIVEKVLGAEHPYTATLFNNIAGVYQDQGEYKKALEYYKKALAINEKVLGSEHPDTATTYNNMAVVYQTQGNYNKALEYYNKALAISEKVLGTEHPKTARMYNNLAEVYKDRGDYEKALEYYNKALAIREKVYGAEHLDTMITYSNIALVYKAQGDYEKALEYHKKALAISEKVQGSEHPDTATTYINIAAVYRNLGDYQKSKKYLHKAYSILSNVFGDNHPYTKIAKKLLDEVSQKLDQ